MPLKELDTAPELRDDPSLKDFNDVATLAKSFKDTKAFVGSSIRPPGPDATPEARKEFYEKLVKHAPDLVPLRDGDAEAEKLVWGKLGRPEKPEGYTAEVPKDVPVNLDVLREVAANAGMTNKQFQALVTKTVAGVQKQMQTTAADKDTLKTEWGGAYDAKLRDAAAVAAKLGWPKEAVAQILGGDLSSTQLKGWDAIAKAVGKEGHGIGDQRGGGNEALTPAELNSRFKELQANPAYMDRNHPQHDEYVQRGVKIMQQLHPD